MSRAIVASIGTTHPWNVAGVGRDAQVCAELGLRHCMAVAGVSAQDERGVHELHAIPPQVLRAQLHALPADVAVYRVGALASSANVHELAGFVRSVLAAHSERWFVVDPVAAATLGGSLGGPALLEALARELCVLPVVLTPNLPEAAALLGREIRGADDARAAAVELRARGARAVLLKGGHLRGDPVDVLADEVGVRCFEDARLPGTMSGTGCTLAAALACELARGSPLSGAVRAARAYVRAKIAASRYCAEDIENRA